MVELKKLKKGNKEYFYLAHSYRDGKSIKKKQMYLGDSIPKNIKEQKKAFMQEFYSERFLKNIDKIKKKFNAEYKSMPKSAKEKSKENFAINFTYNTQRIEGSTLTLKETAALLEEGISPASKPIRDAKEAESHKKVFFEMLDHDKNMNFQTILKWHKNLMQNTHEDIAGKIRNHDVAIAQSKFKPPMHLDLNTLLKEFFDWYIKNKKDIHPVELAALVHLKFVTIHPFSDGNGRISRLMMNFILKDNNFPLLDIEYTKRTSYYNALERSQVKENSNIFVQWFFGRYLAAHKKYLK
jgi:Fic family protein